MMITAYCLIIIPIITDPNFQPTMNSQTLQREIDMVRANRYEISDDMQGSSSAGGVPRVARHQQQQNINAGKNQQQLSQQEQFLRSASARLPNKKGVVSDQEEVNRLDGERKREESMKRLLEWKQRMLQSPLTRKGAPLSVAPTNTQSLHLPPKSPLTIQGHQSNWQTLDNSVSGQKSNHALQRSRSDTHAISGYGNDDSSDDEGEFLKSFLLENSFEF